MIEKYKPKVTDALTRVKKVIIDEGKRIIIEIIDDIVKIVVEDLQEDEIVKELAALSEDSQLMDAQFFFSECKALLFCCQKSFCESFRNFPNLRNRI